MKNLWDDDLIQFARLICEISANVEISDNDWLALYQSMDLQPRDLHELFDRANKRWEEHKEKLRRKHGTGIR